MDNIPSLNQKVLSGNSDQKPKSSTLFNKYKILLNALTHIKKLENKTKNVTQYYVIRPKKKSNIALYEYVTVYVRVRAEIRIHLLDYRGAFTIDAVEWGNDYDLGHQLKCL